MLRECAQREEEQIEVPEEVTVADFRELIIRHIPTLEKKTFKVACNKKVVAEDVFLPTNAEIALLPPYSGG